MGAGVAAPVSLSGSGSEIVSAGVRTGFRGLCLGVVCSDRMEGRDGDASPSGSVEFVAAGPGLPAIIAGVVSASLPAGCAGCVGISAIFLRAES